MTGIADRLGSALARLPVLEPGHVWLTGAGPGDPGLLTLHAVGGLSQADVVVHDALVDPRVLALARPDAALEFAGKRGGKPSPAQGDITGRLIALAREGKRVLAAEGRRPVHVRPGRRGGARPRCRRRPVPHRPGRHLGLAALTMASIPATCRGVNRALILVTGQGGEEDAPFDWGALARTGQPIVLYMGLRNLDTIAAALIAGGLAPQTPAAVIASATLPAERILVSELHRVAAEAAALNLESPAIIAIGAIVAIRTELLDLALRIPELVA